ncbi:MAG: D-alanyl-D-alanine carboxypeptidase family protein [Candidatus Curtissbacteria bacterium]
MGRVISVFLFLCLIFSIFYFSRSDNSGVVLPVPKVFGAVSNAQDSNSWFPQTTTDVSAQKIQLGAKSAILVDYDTKKVLYEKNPKERLPVASVVKIMTALIALEEKSLGDVFTVSEKAYRAGENSMDLSPGEKLTLDELLHGLILVSGNDAAVTIAEGVAGSEDSFVDMMNSRAKGLGALDTKFINASGLDVDYQTQFSSAYDMATIAHFLWENHPEFRKISETYHFSLAATAEHKEFDLYNDTNLLTTYPGVRGIKPGFTWEAGMCLVTYVEYDGHRLIGVVLGSGDRRGEMKELLDFGFATWGIRVPHPGLDLEG